MRRVFIATLLLCCLPGLALAAGFAKQSLFLSKSPVIEGETVFIYAVVANDSSTKFAGKVAFSDSDTEIGSVSVAMAAGGAQTVSISWKPSAGSHTVTAKLIDSSGAAAESESATFTINEKPKPAVENSAAVGDSTTVGSSEDIQQSIKNISPTAADLSQPLFSSIDSLRQTMAGGLTAGINWAKKQTASQNGSVLGDQTQKNLSSGGLLDTFLSVLAAVALTVLTALLYVVSNAGIFYPVLAVVFLYILWRLYKRFRRPSYGV